MNKPAPQALTFRWRLRAPIFFRAAALLALFLILPAQGFAQHFPSDEELRSMARYVVEDQQKGVGGVVIGVLEADGSRRIVSYGDAGAGARPLGARTVFEIASVNKTFTGILLADAVARGEVALSDPISRHLPKGLRLPTRNGREITLLDLATHYSGLPRNADNMPSTDPRNPYAGYTAQHLYAFLAAHELRRDPGAQYEYSNLGAGLLSHILARAAGAEFKPLLQRRVLRPLGLSMTSYERRGHVGAWMAKGFNAAGQPTPYYDLDILAGAGGLNSNAEDLLRYLAAHIAPPATRLGRAMQAAQQVQRPAQGPLSMGLGWQVITQGERQFVVHNGGTQGSSSLIGFDPAARIGVVFLSNRGDVEPSSLVQGLMSGPSPVIRKVDVPRSELAGYAGEYAFAATGGSMAVQLEDDGYLTVRRSGTERFRLYPEGGSKFIALRTPLTLTFNRAETGEVTGMTVETGGRVLEGRRAQPVRP